MRAPGASAASSNPEPSEAAEIHPSQRRRDTRLSDSITLILLSKSLLLLNTHRPLVGYASACQPVTLRRRSPPQSNRLPRLRGLSLKLKEHKEQSIMVNRKASYWLLGGAAALAPLIILA